MVVLVEVLQAGKENAHTEYVSVPMRINHWTFNGKKRAQCSQLPTKVAHWFPQKMVLYLGPFLGIYYLSNRH